MQLQTLFRFKCHHVYTLHACSHKDSLRCGCFAPLFVILSKTQRSAWFPGTAPAHSSSRIHRLDTLLVPTHHSLAFGLITVTSGSDQVFYVAGRWSPEEEAGLWSRLFFSFCTGLIKMGKQKALNPEDLWDLPHSDEAAAVSQVCACAIICCM